MNDFHVIDAIRQLDNQPQSRFHDLRKSLPEQCNSEMAALSIDLLHVSKVAHEVSICEKLRYCQLCRPIRSRCHQRNCFDNAFRQYARRNDEAEAERGADRLTECADVDYALRTITRSQGGRRPSDQLQFAQVIIFDDPGIFRFSPCEQRPPSCRRESDPQRRMLAGRDQC
ncbi:hypothetical protein XF14_03615 [Burkholderia gladioli]|nr:hypothetical protein XF14_03615 [Burkholderia gladioli]